MGFITFMRSFISLVYNFFYWSIYNFRFGTRIYNYRLSRSIKPGRHVMIRSKTEIGRDVSIGNYSYISGPVNYIESASIGKFCSIARQTVIGVGDHNYNWVTTHPVLAGKSYGLIESDNTVDQKAAPVIGNDVWVGINVIITRGVVIGDGAVIAAGSVVTKNVEPYSIVGGVPARHIKYRFSADIIAGLLESKWWDWDDNKLEAMVGYMYNPELFVSKYREHVA